MTGGAASMAAHSVEKQGLHNKPHHLPNMKVMDTNCTMYNTEVPDFGEFLMKETFADVHLVCKGHKIPAHRSRLSSVSPFLATVFAGDTSEVSVVIVPDVRYEALRLLIHFLYTGFMRATENEVHEILEAGHTLGIDRAIDVERDTSFSIVEPVRSRKRLAAEPLEMERKKKTARQSTVFIINAGEYVNSETGSFCHPGDDPLNIPDVYCSTLVTQAQHSAGSKEQTGKDQSSRPSLGLQSRMPMAEYQLPHPQVGSTSKNDSGFWENTWYVPKQRVPCTRGSALGNVPCTRDTWSANAAERGTASTSNRNYSIPRGRYVKPGPCQQTSTFKPRLSSRNRGKQLYQLPSKPVYAINQSVPGTERNKCGQRSTNFQSVGKCNTSVTRKYNTKSTPAIKFSSKSVSVVKKPSQPRGVTANSKHIRNPGRATNVCFIRPASHIAGSVPAKQKPRKLIGQQAAIVVASKKGFKHTSSRKPSVTNKKGGNRTKLCSTNGATGKCVQREYKSIPTGATTLKLQCVTADHQTSRPKANSAASSSWPSAVETLTVKTRKSGKPRQSTITGPPNHRGSRGKSTTECSNSSKPTTPNHAYRIDSKSTAKLLTRENMPRTNDWGISIRKIGSKPIETPAASFTTCRIGPDTSVSRTTNLDINGISSESINRSISGISISRIGPTINASPTAKPSISKIGPETYDNKPSDSAVSIVAIPKAQTCNAYPETKHCHLKPRMDSSRKGHFRKSSVGRAVQKSRAGLPNTKLSKQNRRPGVVTTETSVDLLENRASTELYTLEEGSPLLSPNSSLLDMSWHIQTTTPIKQICTAWKSSTNESTSNQSCALSIEKAFDVEVKTEPESPSELSLASNKSQKRKGHVVVPITTAVTQKLLDCRAASVSESVDTEAMSSNVRKSGRQKKFPVWRYENFVDIV
ncbi:hypothetical protein B566_EDAN001928 [Ephemera danica]|nr:hypothetical protein B566_EDAN001928 [Ephemera danica]